MVIETQDIIVLTGLIYLSILAYQFFHLARLNMCSLRSGTSAKMHAIEHVLIGGIWLIGCVSYAVSCGIRIAALGDKPPDGVLLLSTISGTLMIIAAALFVRHLIKEESAEHPFCYHHTEDHAR